jgi:hypothetical protein
VAGVEGVVAAVSPELPVLPPAVTPGAAALLLPPPPPPPQAAKASVNTNIKEDLSFTILPNGMNGINCKTR